MNLKFESIKIDPANPFVSDLLNRKDEIENLSTLVRNINSPAVLAIDSRWGTGKTTFIKLWEQHLKKEGLEPLYFNAWETDFSDDPLVAFLGEINESLKALIGVSTKSKKAWSKTKAAGKQIAKRGIPALIKIGTAGIIDADKLVEDELSKAMESLSSDALNDYLQQKSAITEFHKSLQELIKVSSKGKPVVIFVDELDRCRPTYAIALLERIKHLFNIKGIVFVLALDKVQLGYSISSIYGSGFDTNGYLRRFIDFEYQLKIPKLKTYINSLFSALELDKYFEPRAKYEKLKHDKQKLENILLALAKTHNLTLREIEQLLASINLALRTTKDNEFIHPVLLAFLVVTKNLEPEIYNRYIMESTADTEIIDYLRKTMSNESREESYDRAEIEALLIMAKLNIYGDSESIKFTEHKNIINDDSLTREQQTYSHRVVETAKYLTSMGHSVNLTALVKRIELLTQFNFASE